MTRRSAASSPAAVQQLPNWLSAARAAESKKASNIAVLDLRDVTSFTDYFIICSVANPRQAHAVADEIEKQLKQIGELPNSVEGYDTAEWILIDYGDFVVHVFSEAARSYYDLERLWRHAKSIDIPDA
ncbi:MAG: ribosome silencing factor [Acidobacteriaceae bacterium]|nr:ribosome silencing factor [Acidobacteriaceae bacterium]